MSIWQQAEKLLKREQHVTHYPNGKRKEVYYTIDGKIEGEYLEYWDDGQLNERKFYKNDELIESITYTPADSMTIRHPMKNTKYYVKGLTIVEHEFYRNGKLNGKCRRWYDTGLIESVNFFKDGKMHGKQLSYNLSDNILKEVSHYKNGKLDGEYRLYWTSYSPHYLMSGETPPDDQSLIGTLKEFIIFKNDKSQMTIKKKGDKITIRWFDYSDMSEQEIIEKVNFLKENDKDFQ